LNQSDYNLGELAEDSIPALKRNLKEECRVLGFFHRDKLIGFVLSCIDGRSMEPLIIGMDYSISRETNLYQRILYDLVEDAIRRRMTQLVLGRTGEVAKSGLGAQPKQMRLFAKHRNVVSNNLLKSFISTLEPRKFEQRNPFKQKGPVERKII
jgi:hypothetical protein